MKFPALATLLWRGLLLGLGLALLLISPGASRPVQAGTLTGFTLSNPRCVQVRVDNGACSISFASASASGSDTTFQRITVSINNKLRVNLQGFFDTSGSLYSNMLPGGLQVACGRPGAGGDPKFGNLYVLQVQANMYSNPPAIDTASVYCPYYDGKVFLPAIER